MKHIEIKRWDNNKIIVAGKYESVRDCIEKNKGNVNFRSADLRSAHLSYADLSSAHLSSAHLSSAHLSYADLSYADLSYADLSYADLSSADLSYADLSYADLSSAHLSSADLSSAHLEEPYFLPDLYILKMQPPATKLTAWKYIVDGHSPYRSAQYEVGKEYEEDDYNADETASCGAGLNVATLQWCLQDNTEADEFLEVEFRADDIVAVPYGTDGKFRVRKMRVLRELNREEAINELKSKMNREDKE